VRDDTLPQLGVRLEDRPDGEQFVCFNCGKQCVLTAWLDLYCVCQSRLFVTKGRGVKLVALVAAWWSDDMLPQLGVRLEDRPDGETFSLWTALTTAEV
jgi:hypothetical protein